jgi:hypothetical protein
VRFSLFCFCLLVVSDCCLLVVVVCCVLASTPRHGGSSVVSTPKIVGFRSSTPPTRTNSTTPTTTGQEQHDMDNKQQTHEQQFTLDEQFTSIANDRTVTPPTTTIQIDTVERPIPVQRTASLYSLSHSTRGSVSGTASGAASPSLVSVGSAYSSASSFIGSLLPPSADTPLSTVQSNVPMDTDDNLQRIRRYTAVGSVVDGLYAQVPLLAGVVQVYTAFKEHEQALQAAHQAHQQEQKQELELQNIMHPQDVTLDVTTPSSPSPATASSAPSSVNGSGSSTPRLLPLLSPPPVYSVDALSATSMSSVLEETNDDMMNTGGSWVNSLADFTADQQALDGNDEQRNDSDSSSPSSPLSSTHPSSRLSFPSLLPDSSHYGSDITPTIAHDSVEENQQQDDEQLDLM